MVRCSLEAVSESQYTNWHYSCTARAMKCTLLTPLLARCLPKHLGVRAVLLVMFFLLGGLPALAQVDTTVVDSLPLEAAATDTSATLSPEDSLLQAALTFTTADWAPRPINMERVLENVRVPKLLRQEGYFGRVVVRVLVDKGGNVRQWVVLSSPHISFTRAVEAQLRYLLFEPAYNVEADGSQTRVPFWYPVVYYVRPLAAEAPADTSGN